MRGCAGVDVLQKVSGVRFVISGFVCRFVCHHASLFRTSLRDLCRRLLARLTSATKFMYYENGYDESSRRGEPLRTVPVALHAMCNTVHRLGARKIIEITRRFGVVAAVYAVKVV